MKKTKNQIGLRLGIWDGRLINYSILLTFHPNIQAYIDVCRVNADHFQVICRINVGNTQSSYIYPCSFSLTSM